MQFRSFLQNKTHFAHLNAASSSSAQKESFVLVGDKERRKGPFRKQAGPAGSACLSAKINEESVGGTAADAICLMTLARRSDRRWTAGRSVLEMLRPETCFAGVGFLIHGSLCEMGWMDGRDSNWLIRYRLC